MKNSILYLLIYLISLAGYSQNLEIPTPTPAQLAWQNAELAALVCIDLHAFDGQFYKQSEARITPVADYNYFNPRHYDTDQWIKTLKDGGFKIAILTVSHESGFVFYQSDVNPYCMKAIKWQDGKGDVVRDFVNSCKKYDILPGIYIGTRWNSFFGIYDFKVNGEGQFADNRQKYYNRMIEKEVEELFTHYGDWAIVWFDGGAHGPEQGGPDVLSAFEKYQPNSLFYHNLQRSDMRWGGSETGTVPYPCWATFPLEAFGNAKSDRKKIQANNFELLKRGDPNGKYYMPAMSDAPLRGNGGHDWFYEPGRENIIYPIDKLVNIYYNSVGHNTTLILGVTPNPDGLIPEADTKRLKEFGDEINKLFSNPVAKTSGKGKKIALKCSGKIDQVVLMEDIVQGERVRQFVVEGRTSQGWHKLAEGSCIGHKFIDEFDEVNVSSVRLIIKESIAEPLIKDFSVF